MLSSANTVLFLLNVCPFHCLNALIRTSNKILSRSGEKDILTLVQILGGQKARFSALSRFLIVIRQKSSHRNLWEGHLW